MFGEKQSWGTDLLTISGHVSSHRSLQALKGSFVYLPTGRSRSSVTQETIAFPSGLKGKARAAAYIYKI